MKSPSTPFITSVLLFTLCLGVYKAAAQERFAEIEIGLTGHTILTGNTIYHSWNASEGISLDISAPYQFGSFETGFRYLRYDEADFEDSGFHSTYVFLGWSYPLRFTERLSFRPALRIGIHFLTQDHHKYYNEVRFQRNESEFSYELSPRLHYRISESWSLNAGVAYNRTPLNIPYSLWYGSAGLTYRFSTPEWLKTILR